MKDSSLLEAIARQMCKDFSLLVLFSALGGCLRDIAYFRKVALATFLATIGVVLSVYVGRFFPHAPIVKYWVIPPVTGDRSPGMFVQTYLAGEYLIVGIGLLLAYFFYSNSPWRKPFCVGAALAYVLAMLYGQSRSTYLAVAVMLLVAMVARVRNFLWGVLLVIVVGVTIGSEPQLVKHLVGRFQGRETAGLGGRLDSWRQWLSVTDNVSWFLGNGFQYSALKSHTGGHSSYLEAWSDAGVVGLLAFVALWPAVLRTRKSILTSPLLADGDKAAGLGFCWVAIALLVSSMMIGFVTDTYYRTIFLLVMSLAAAPCLGAACWTPRFAFSARLAPRTSFQ
jgi:O-antigen ligase